MFEICSDLSKTGLKIYSFVNIQKRPKMAKWPNHFISGKQIGQMATLRYVAGSLRRNISNSVFFNFDLTFIQVIRYNFGSLFLSSPSYAYVTFYFWNCLFLKLMTLWTVTLTRKNVSFKVLILFSSMTFLLPVVLKSKFKKANNVHVTLCRTPPPDPRVSHIIWMAIYSIKLELILN